jgi:hypothetical protein
MELLRQQLTSLKSDVEGNEDKLATLAKSIQGQTAEMQELINKLQVEHNEEVSGRLHLLEAETAEKFAELKLVRSHLEV